MMTVRLPQSPMLLNIYMNSIATFLYDNYNGSFSASLSVGSYGGTVTGSGQKTAYAGDPSSLSNTLVAKDQFGNKYAKLDISNSVTENSGDSFTMLNTLLGNYATPVGYKGPTDYPVTFTADSTVSKSFKVSGDETIAIKFGGDTQGNRLDYALYDGSKLIDSERYEPYNQKAGQTFYYNLKAGHQYEVLTFIHADLTTTNPACLKAVGSVDVEAVPEPTTVGLFIGLPLLLRKRFKKSSR